jgi:hypothetical protein
MSSDDDRGRTFPCKESGCDEVVTYKRQLVIGAVQLLPAEKRTKPRRMYLTCPKQHTNLYDV